jgi:transposase
MKKTRAKTPLTEALAYAHKRRAQLELFLNDPDLPLDTNHLKRSLRVIPMGRKNWNFCWTELGAEHVGIMQSLIVTCRLHGVDPYTYLVEVLQRLGVHPASKVAELTPRLWKQHFAANPLQSALHTAPST